MKRIMLMICVITTALTLCAYFASVNASGEKSGELGLEASGEISGDKAIMANANDVSLVAPVVNLPINPGSYYVTNNSFAVKKDADFPDLITKVYDKKERKYYDVPHVYRREILIAARIGFLEGYEDGTFKPDNLITRAEFIKMLMGLVTNRTFNFEAIPTTYYNWAGKFVTLAEMQGVIEKGKYSEEQLEEPITRLEMICMLAKVQIKMKGIPQNQLGHLIFTDIDGLTEEEKGLLLHAAKYDLLEGMKDGSMKEFEPNKEITRGETARALVRIY